MQSVRFDRAASYYDATRGLAPGSAERIREAIVAYSGANKATRFLEIGVGTGRIALPFIAAGYRFVGVDLSRPMLAVLREKLPAGVLPPVAEGDITRLPIADGQIDVVIGVHILHLVGEWRAALAEVRRVLRRPGGRLILAGDTSRDETEEHTDLPPPVAAQRAWRTILAELGEQRQPLTGARPHDPAVLAELKALGATVAELNLTEYQRPPISARQVLDGARQRIYSSDWARPDALHQQAVARLERWLAEQCPDPDTPHSLSGRFWAVVARW